MRRPPSCISLSSVLTSLRAGLVAGLIVSVVAIVCLDYFFTPPLFRVQIGEIDAVAMIVFGTTVLVINHLMTRVRKSFEEIQRSEATLREQAGLLDLTHDSVFVRDMNSVITYWNRGAEELYGWRRDEAVGRVTHELLQTAFPVPRRTDYGSVAPHGPLGGGARPHQARWHSR